MAPNEIPIEDPYRRSRRITPVKPTRRIGLSNANVPVARQSEPATPSTDALTSRPAAIPATAAPAASPPSLTHRPEPDHAGLPTPARITLAETTTATRPRFTLTEETPHAHIETPAPSTPAKPTTTTATPPVQLQAAAALTATRPSRGPQWSQSPEPRAASPAPRVIETPPPAPTAAEPPAKPLPAIVQAAPAPTEKILPKRERIPRPRASDEPATGNTLKGAFTITVLSAALLGYAFNIGSLQTSADSFMSKLNQSAQMQGSTVVPVMARLIPWLILLPVVVLFYAIMKTLAGAIGLGRKNKIKAGRQRRKRPLDEFKKAADHHGITPRTAYQCFLLLQPFLPDGGRPELDDTLESDLGISPPQLRELHLNLLRATGREADTAARLPVVTTVLDLLTAAQRAPKKTRDPLDPVFEPGDPRMRRSK